MGKSDVTAQSICLQTERQFLIYQKGADLKGADAYNLLQQKTQLNIVLQENDRTLNRLDYQSNPRNMELGC